MRLFIVAFVLGAATLAGFETQTLHVTVAGRDVPFGFQPSQVAAPLAVVLGLSADPGLPTHWNVAVPQAALAGDWGVKVLEAVVAEASRNQKVLTDRVYLIAGGDLSSMAFYAASRSPALFAGAVALGGNPKSAIDSNRLFGGNTANTPVFWVGPQGNRELLNLVRTRLRAAEFRYQEVATPADAIARLGELKFDPFPVATDCETGSPLFGRCFWVEILSLDAAKRNDAFRTTRVQPGSGASLGIGPFGYDPAVPGPGAVVGWLPEGYKGPLAIGDRIVSVEGKPVENGAAYLQLMEEYTDEKAIVVMVQRGKDRKRLETRIALPKREEMVTGRLQGQYLADSREILLGSRGVGRLRLYVPPQWAGASVNWNGDAVGAVPKEGCYTVDASGLHGCDQR